MEIVLIPNGTPRTLREAFRYSQRYVVRANDPEMKEHEGIVVRKRARKIRIYTQSPLRGGYDEYELAHIIEMGGNTYYIAGKLLETYKPDYVEPVQNNLQEVVS